MSQLGTVYATKRRRRNGKSLKPPPKDGVTKSNPSKRHRERLNAELDLLASLLPFEQNILSKLDRLSILRLSVSYLRTKSYFQVVMHKDKEENGLLSHINPHDSYRSRELGAFEHNLLEGDMFLQALNGFLMILTCEGEVFFATHSIESYLGFHQSDIVHQSVYELVHSEDREELQRQLLWNSLLPADLSGITLAEALAPDKSINLERSFTVRFRCLLDNTSGFLRLDIRGRIKILHGQNRKTEEPPLGLFAFCTPFGPPSLLEIPQKENMFKSKHKLDLSLVSMDQRGKIALGYSDTELVNMGGYDLVHFDDLGYVASAHQELLKTGASGMIAYRYQKKNGEWQWLQTSSRLVYKNSKPDFVICTHRQLMDEEGRDLLGKRTMDFKVSYLDTGLASTYFSEADQLVVVPTSSPTSLPPPVTPQRPNRRYKTQLRDFLSTCRSKRKLQQSSPLGQVTPPAPVVEYIPDPAAAVAAAYSNLNPMYTTSPYGSAADNLYISPSVHSTNFYPVTTENLFHQYRLQGGYYPDYHHTSAPAPYVTNGFLSYEGYGLKDDKWQDTSKYYSNYSSGYGSPTSSSQIPIKTPKSSPHIMEIVSCSSDGPSPVNSTSNHTGGNPTTNPQTGTPVITPKIENSPPEHFERQTVLMWGTGGENNTAIPVSVVNTATRSPINTPSSNGGVPVASIYNENQQRHKMDDPPQQQQLQEPSHLKWNGNSTGTKEIIVATDGSMYHIHHQHSNESVDSSTASMYGNHPHSQQHHHHHINTSNHNGGSVTDLAQHHQSAAGHNRADVIMQASSNSNSSQNSNIDHLQHHHHHHNPQHHSAHLHLHSHHNHHSQSAAHHAHIPPTSAHHSITASSTPLGSSATSCEVWSPASYSQYSQYLSYHHASQHPSTQSSLNEITPSDPYHIPHNSSNNNNNNNNSNNTTTNNNNSSNNNHITTSTTTTNSSSNVSLDTHHPLVRHHLPSPHHHHRLSPLHHLPPSSVHQQSSVPVAQSQISTQSSLHPVQHHPIPLPPSSLHHHHPHHPYHHQHATSVGNISPISPLTQLSRTHHPMRTITRTGVLCCPSLR